MTPIAEVDGPGSTDSSLNVSEIQISNQSNGITGAELGIATGALSPQKEVGSKQNVVSRFLDPSRQKQEEFVETTRSNFELIKILDSDYLKMVDDSTVREYSINILREIKQKYPEIAEAREERPRILNWVEAILTNIEQDNLSIVPIVSNTDVIILPPIMIDAGNKGLSQRSVVRIPIVSDSLENPVLWICPELKKDSKQEVSETLPLDDQQVSEIFKEVGQEGYPDRAVFMSQLNGLVESFPLVREMIENLIKTGIPTISVSKDQSLFSQLRDIFEYKNDQGFPIGKYILIKILQKGAGQQPWPDPVGYYEALMLNGDSLTSAGRGQFTRNYYGF